MIPIFIILGTFLYWLGGQKFAHTLFRDVGTPICMLGVAIVALGWHWTLLFLVISWGGMAIGDHERWFWSIHAFVIGLGMSVYAVLSHYYWQFGLMLAVVTVGTYLVSRFCNRFGFDVIGRGLLYSTVPLWFLIR